MQCADAAVVSSSSSLLAKRLGNEIDAHTCVFRMGHAPTANYEAYVGNRTTHRLIGPAMLHMLAGDYRNRKGDTKTSHRIAMCDGCETMSNMNSVIRSKATLCRSEQCIFLHKSSFVDHRNKDSKTLTRLEPRILSLSPLFSDKLLRWAHCDKPPRHGFVGAGLAALIVARMITHGVVRAYGFECGHECCRDKRPYNYYETDNGARCCQHVESNSEGPLYRHLETTHAVSFSHSRFSLCNSPGREKNCPIRMLQGANSNYWQNPWRFDNSNRTQSPVL